MSSALATVDIDYDLDEELRRGRADGSLLRAKAKMVLEHFGITKISDMLQRQGTPDSTILDASRFLMRLADMEPKTNVTAGVGGSGFSLTINIPQGGQAPGKHQDDITDIAPVTLVLSEPELPPRPSGFKMPAFDLTKDLIGPPLPNPGA